MAEAIEDILRVGGGTQPDKLGSTIARKVVEGRKVVLRAVGAPAVNQAVKGFIIAQEFVASSGLVISLRGGFVDVPMPDKTVTGIILRVIVE